MQREIAQDQKLCISPYGNQVSYVSRLSRKESADGSGANMRRHFHSTPRCFSITLQVKSEDMRIRDLSQRIRSHLWKWKIIWVTKWELDKSHLFIHSANISRVFLYNGSVLDSSLQMWLNVDEAMSLGSRNSSFLVWTNNRSDKQMVFTAK